MDDWKEWLKDTIGAFSLFAIIYMALVFTGAM